MVGWLRSASRSHGFGQLDANQLIVRRPVGHRLRRRTATTTASARCSRSGSSRAMNGARCRLVSSRRLRTTRPFSLTVRARSFLPTGCRSTSTASSSATRKRNSHYPPWGGAGGCVWGDCNGLPTNSVRYNSPTFGGFSVSASWGEDDFWDVAARYAGEWPEHQIKVSVAAAFSHVSDFQRASISRATWHSLRVAITSRLVPTPSTSRQACSSTAPTVISTRTAISLRTTMPTIPGTCKAGLRSHCNPLGHTVFYGEYLRAENNNVVVQRLDQKDTVTING